MLTRLVVYLRAVQCRELLPHFLVAGNVDKQRRILRFLLIPGFPVQKQQMTVMGHKHAIV